VSQLAPVFFRVYMAPNVCHVKLQIIISLFSRKEYMGTREF